MAVVSTKNLKIWFQKKLGTPTVLVPTAISKAAKPVITVASTTGMAVGDVVLFADTGFTELNGQTAIVTALTPTTFTVAGVDTTASTGVLAGTPKASVWFADDFCPLCLSAIDLGDNAVTAVSVATFCNPSASVPGNPAPATTTFTGYVDVADPCYSELLAAVADGLPRYLKVDLPGSNGYFLTQVIVGSVAYTIPLEGSVGFSFTSTQSVALEHIF